MLQSLCGKDAGVKDYRNSGIPWHAIVRLLPDEGGCLTRRADILSARSAGSPQDESVRLADWKPCRTIQVRHGESVPWRTGNLRYYH